MTATQTDIEVRLVRNTASGTVHVDAKSLTDPTSRRLLFGIAETPLCCGPTVPVEQGRWEWVVGCAAGALCGVCVRVLSPEDRLRVYGLVRQGGASDAS